MVETAGGSLHRLPAGSGSRAGERKHSSLKSPVATLHFGDNYKAIIKKVIWSQLIYTSIWNKLSVAPRYMS